MGQNMTIALSDIHFNLANPRTGDQSDADSAIQKLLREEKVYNLARDICENGLNPLERIGVMADEGSHTYVTKDGNRRLCALILLDDPERAPADVRDKFKKLRDEQSDSIAEVEVHVFDTSDKADLWMERMHSGELNGVGRRHWDAEQSTRHARRTGTNRTRYLEADQLLEYARSIDLITPEQNNIITTLHRHVINTDMRQFLGYDVHDGSVFVHVTQTAFQDRLNTLFRAIVEGDLTSRSKPPDRDSWIATQSTKFGKVDSLYEAWRLEDAVDRSPKGGRKNAPTPSTKNKKRSCIGMSNRVMTHLSGMSRNSKFISLYTSIASIKLDQHTPIIAVGLWSFIESMYQRLLRAEGTGSCQQSFVQYFDTGRLQDLKLGGRRNSATIEALKRIHSHGNVTKHDGTGAMFESQQIRNDVETLEPFIIACCKRISDREQE